MALESKAAHLTGTTFGRYAILSRIAVGGMAEIWLARELAHGDFGNELVLKTMLPQAAESRDHVAMFVNEGSVGLRLRHPNIVRTLAAGEIEGRRFIALEHLPGLTVRQFARELRDLDVPLPVGLLLRIAIETCRALQYAHDLREGDRPLGLVHRDVAPENIMLLPSGAVKVIDFGAARTTSVPGATAHLIGKLHYVCPERLLGWAEDRRCDVYAVGVMLYEYLAGARPYEGEDKEIISRIVEGRHRPLDEAAPHLRPELVAIVERAMSPLRDERHGSAEALANDLLTYLRVRATDHPGKADARALDLVFEGLLSEAQTQPGVTPLLDAIPTTVNAIIGAAAAPAVGTGTGKARKLVAVSDRARAATPVVTPPPLPVAAAARSEEIPSRANATAPFTAGSGTAAWATGRTPVPPSAAFGGALLPASGPRKLTADTAESANPAAGVDVFASRRVEAGAFAGGSPLDVARPSLREPELAWALPRRGESQAVRIAPASSSGWGTTVASATNETAAPSDAPAPPTGPAAEAFEAGLNALARGAHDETLQAWERAVALAPDNRTYKANLKRLRDRMAHQKNQTRETP